MRTVTEAIYKTKYEAYDGTRFDNESDCIEYENNVRTIVAAWEKIPKLEYSEESLHLGGGYSDVHYVVYCRDQHDIDAANAYIKECAGYTKERFTDKCIGKRIVISVWSVDSSGLGEDVVFYGEPKDVIKDMADLLYAPIPDGDANKLRVYSVSADAGMSWTIQYLTQAEANIEILSGYIVKEGYVNE